ncbi:Cytochrome P450 704C1 [Diplonema papillatum]|nr:Cytochrome P450 704C1 [Diplonema papillatum]
MLWVLFAVLRATVALVALVIASAVVKTVYVYFEQRRSYAILQRRFKGPVTWPWGGAFERYKAYPRILQMHYNFIQQYGGAAKSYLLMAPIFARGLHGARNEIVTADPVLVKHVLHDKFDIYTKSTIAGRPIRSIQQLLGNGIFIIDHGPHASVPRDGGKMWRQQRRTALQIFSRSLFQNSYEQVFLDHGSRLISLLKKETSDGVATVDLQSYFFRYTMDAIGHIAFGEQLGNLEFGKDEFGNAFDQAHTEMITCMKKSVPMWLFAGLFPDAVSMLMLRFFDAYCLPAQKAFQKQIAILDKYCYAIIARRRKEYEERTSKTEKPDLLGYFVAAEDDDGRRLYSDKDLRDVIMSFMLAGRDTTACTLSWLFFEISLPENESILEALLSEVDTVLSGTPPTYDSLQDLPYLRGVVWETLRLHPVVPLTVSHSQRPDTLPDGTEVPVGTTISVQSYTMGRDKDRWGDDADEFRPERWIPFKQPSPYEFPQFKAGPRICLGKDMALYEASIVTIIVLQSFRPVAARTRKDIVPSQKATICCHDVTSRKDELWTHLHRREPPTGQ